MSSTEGTTPKVVHLTSSSNGRTSGKSWKSRKSATVRTHAPDGVKAKSFEDRMEKTKKELAIKKLQAELKEEKQAELTRRREITLERKKGCRRKKETGGREGQNEPKKSCQAPPEGGS